MSLHLIIDGYNLIRQSPRLQELDARELEAGREALLEYLAGYRRTRPQHRLTVVFDGWQGGGLQESRDRRPGILIIYSRRGERADEVIKRLLARERERAVVVSSDRELQEFAHRVGASWINATQFEADHLRRSLEDPSPEADEEPLPHSDKKGPSHRPSKQQRRLRQRLRKL